MVLPAADPIVKDQGIALRWFPVTDTSRIVVWFTEEHGRLSTLIRGSQRPKSWMLGQYDLFTTCEVLFYVRAREDLHILRECSTLSPRSSFRQNWRNCMAASFVADLLYRLPPPRGSSAPLFRLGSQILDTLNRQPAVPAHLFWFELQFYQDWGVAPDLSPPSEDPQLHFNPRAGQLTAPTRETLPVSRGSLNSLLHLQEAKDPSHLSRLKLLPEQVREIAGVLDAFTQWHLDTSLDSRRLALQGLMRA